MTRANYCSRFGEIRNKVEGPLLPGERIALYIRVNLEDGGIRDYLHFVWDHEGNEVFGRVVHVPAPITQNAYEFEQHVPVGREVLGGRMLSGAYLKAMRSIPPDQRRDIYGELSS